MATINSVTKNKKDLIDAVYDKLEGAISKEKLSNLVNVIFETIPEMLKKEANEPDDVVKKLVLAGLISFVSKKTAGREGFNPSSGKKIKIEAKRTIRAVIGSRSKQAVLDVQEDPKKKRKK
jgi:DNA-binding protein HU-beta